MVPLEENSEQSVPVPMQMLVYHRELPLRTHTPSWYCPLLANHYCGCRLTPCAILPLCWR